MKSNSKTKKWPRMTVTVTVTYCKCFQPIDSNAVTQYEQSLNSNHQFYTFKYVYRSLGEVKRMKK